MSNYREASAVLLLRGSGADLEIYLVERSPELRFFGGYHALPGGVVEPEDGSACSDRDATLRRCAMRELFEETGVILADADKSQRADVRKALLEGDHGPWQLLLESAGVVAEFREACEITTPPFAPVRYETLFLAAELPEGEHPEIWAGELVSGRFWRPADALEAWRCGELLIVPPVLLLLELLIDGDVDAALVASRNMADGLAAGDLHRVRFSPGVIMASLVTPTVPPATTTNCLIVGEESLFIIDPAPPDATEQQRLCDLLRELQGEGRILEAILLTHHHPDHVGAVPVVSEEFDLPVRAHPLTLERVAPANVGAPIHDGDRLQLGRAPDGSPGWFLEAVFTPGHDRGHLCFRESRYQALIAGDMVSTVSTVVIDPPEGHMQTYMDSLDRLARLPMSMLYPAHGPAFRDGQALVERYIDHRGYRQSLIEETLKTGSSTAEGLLPVVYADTDERMCPLAARSLLAGLEMLAERGKASEDGGIWSYD